MVRSQLSSTRGVKCRDLDQAYHLISLVVPRDYVELRMPFSVFPSKIRQSFLEWPLLLVVVEGINAIMRYHPLQTTLPTVLRSLVAIMILSSVTTAQGRMRERSSLQGLVGTAPLHGQSYNISGASLKLKRVVPVVASFSNDAANYEFTQLPPSQSQELEPMILKAKGHGALTAPVDEQKITAALVVLRGNGTMLVTVCAELQLQAEGTWSTSDSAPQEILLKITGGALTGDLIGSGRLLLTKDRKSFEQLSIEATTPDGRVIKVTFTADAVENRVSLVHLLDERDGYV